MTAYWIANVNVTDPEAYGEYAKLAGPALAKFGGTFLARGGRSVTLEGHDFARHVLVAFPSFEQAEACYHSPEYKAALRLQEGAADRNVCIVEGL